MSVETIFEAEANGPGPGRYLQGNFAPVQKEVTALDLPVTGSLPPELNGRLLRNGPNPYGPAPASHHWFVGDGMVHGIELREGRAVSYRNRWVRTATLANRSPFEDPGGPAEVSPSGENVANTNVIGHGGNVLALVEMSLPHCLTPDLETIGRFDFGGRLTTSMTAHPKVDPVTGELVFFGSSAFPPYLTYHVADATGALVKSEAIEAKGPSMFHDFAVSARHVVFFDLPVVLDLDLVGTGTMPFSWDGGYGARVGVLPRSGTGADVRWFEVDPCYVFHPLNAFDDGETVVVDVVRYNRLFDAGHTGPWEPGVTTTLDRWTIDLTAGTVREERLDDRPQEFPRVDERLAGHRHRYGYVAELGPTSEGTVTPGSNLVKHDLVDQSSQIHPLGVGRAASEGVFVPSSPDSGEDEGFLLTVVYDASSDSSELVVIDARDFGAAPVARVHLPQRVPFGFHGNWVPDPA
jgi:carotenoid cleavage dioxygenase